MSVTLRPGTAADSFAAFRLFQRSLSDLMRRSGLAQGFGVDDPDRWERNRSLFDHLARTAEHFWLAEEDGEPVGYARTILRDGVRELTEFFVQPGRQSAGVGRDLLARAFPADGASRRVIIATADPRALARYLKVGVYPYFPIYYFGRQPEAVAVPTGLAAERLSASPATFDALRALDAALLGHRRDIDHAWLLEDREGYLYRREGRPVGYGYAGRASGPFALLDAGDFPAALAHAETQVAAGGGREVGLEVPLVNRAAVDHLLARGYRMEPFPTFLMSDRPPAWARFENYVVTSPPFFL